MSTDATLSFEEAMEKYDPVLGFEVHVELNTKTKMFSSAPNVFGDEVKRRIILGTYALSAGYYDAYYGSAQKVRTLIQRDFDAAFAKADVLISPTAPTTAFKLGEKLNDPLAMYLNDVATIPANMAGVPGLSLPGGLADEDGLPVGIQLLAPARQDARLYRVGAVLESLLEAQWGGPLLDKAPSLTAPSLTNDAVASHGGSH